jgi:hypothetical protein
MGMPLALSYEDTAGQQSRVAQLVFQNECASRIPCLTSWNQGEEFASLGIGHFIWYPAGTTKENKSFRESFPQLLVFLRNHDVALPDWLLSQEGCPWPDRESFIAAQNSPRMQALRDLLVQTMSLQSAFMFQRLERALPEMLKAAPEHLRSHIEYQYWRVAESPMGAYVLTDYVNFKGEGVSKGERYQGQGWGLMQVLAIMHGYVPGLEAIKEFVRAADALLTRRVANSPAYRQEQRWLNGWRKRLATYTEEASAASHRENP